MGWIVISMRMARERPEVPRMNEYHQAASSKNSASAATFLVERSSGRVPISEWGKKVLHILAGALKISTAVGSSARIWRWDGCRVLGSRDNAKRSMLASAGRKPCKSVHGPSAEQQE
jgi:hypothetical protein